MELTDIRIRDPFIVPHAGEYYMIGTTGSDPWNAGSDFTLYKSADLKGFKPVSRIVDTERLYPGYTQFWAPEIHCVADKFYLLVSCKKGEEPRGTHILVSDRIDGGYTPLGNRAATPLGLECLDATLLFEDGVPYLVYSHEWVQEGGGALYYARMTPELTGLAETPRLLFTGKETGIAREQTYEPTGMKGYVAEGPFFHKRKDGSLVLLWSTISEKGYCVAVSVSKNGIGGHFEPMPLLFDSDGGHCMVFRAFGGSLKITFHQPNISPFERARIFDVLETDSGLSI